MAQRVINIPFEWTPRDYQHDFLTKMDGGLKRALLIWCRRSGKDSTCINYMAMQAIKRVGTYYYLLPTQRQARKVVWLAIDKQGRRIIDQAFPPEIVKRRVDDEMMIELVNGSIIQCVGSENYDSLVGTNVAGIVFSEWAISNPRAWDYMRPILVENGGWAVFNTTPRGKNHAYRMMTKVKDNPNWFFSLKTAADTKHISLEDIEEERRSGMPDERIEQEFYCSFDAVNIGSIFDKWMTKLDAQGKITRAPYDPRFPVQTSWDIGHRDATAIWFTQHIGKEVVAIDYHEEKGKDLRHFVKFINAKDYVYARHIFPHDMNKFEYGAGSTIAEQARQLGIHVTIAPKLGEEEGIEATRVLLARMRFDAVACYRGIDALKSYHYETEGDDDVGDRLILKPKPKHDWASHGCKALQYLAVTPEDFGLIPNWSRPQAQQNGMLGHNGGPAIDDTTDDYDPLASYRGAGRPSAPLSMPFA